MSNEPTHGLSTMSNEPTHGLLTMSNEPTHGLLTKQQDPTRDFNQYDAAVPNDSIPEIEQKLVICSYDLIAKPFTKSRFSRWDEVERFINELPNSKILDAGCGGGNHMFNRTVRDTHCLSNRSKEFIHRIDKFPVHDWYGCDQSAELVKIGLAAGLKVKHADVCNLYCYQTDEFDAVICIAVLHHLSNELRRLTALKELIRVTKPGGTILISVLRDVFATTIKKPKPLELPGDFEIAFQSQPRYYHLFQDGEFERLLDQIPQIKYKRLDEQTNYYFIINVLNKY